MNIKRIGLQLVLFCLVFAACTPPAVSSPTETPGVTQAPATETAVPPSPTPTEAPAPTETPVSVFTGDWNSYSSQLDPEVFNYIRSHFTVRYPADWQAGWFSDSGATIYVISSGDPTETFWLDYTGPRFFVIPDASAEAPTVEDLLDWTDEENLVEAPHAVTINGLEAAMTASRNEEGYSITAWIANGDANVLVTGSTPLENEAEMVPVLEAILQSIVVIDETVSAVPPMPAGLSPEGEQAYNNIAHILLTAPELDQVFQLEDDGWAFYSDGPGLYMTCRTFGRPDTYIHTRFFSCVIQSVPGFDLLTDDLGLYEVQGNPESEYEFDYPHTIYTYFTESGRLGVDHIVQIGRHLYLTGMELVTPLGTSFDDMFGEYEDRVLAEALQVMVTAAEADPPSVLDFPAGASSKALNEYAPLLVDPARLGPSWTIGEVDESYEQDGACRILYHENGPPPAIVNCIFNASAYSLADARAYYDNREFIDATEAVSLSFEEAYFVYLDLTETGLPRYSLSIEINGVYFEVNLINPALADGAELADSLTDEIKALLTQVLEENVSALEN